MSDLKFLSGVDIGRSGATGKWMDRMILQASDIILQSPNILHFLLEAEHFLCRQKSSGDGQWYYGYRADENLYHSEQDESANTGFGFHQQI